MRNSILHNQAGEMRGMLRWIQIAVFVAMSCLAPGTMPAAQSGGLAIVLCTGAGPVSVAVDQNGDPVEMQRKLCTWSICSTFVDPGQPPLLVSNAEFHAFVETALLGIPENSRDWSDQHRPRGPPRFL